jgi:phosphoglycolate phosphatase-like HAD superfamily hydrolase
MYYREKLINGVLHFRKNPFHKWSEKMKDIVIFDIDGTLANGDHRVHHVRKKPKNWYAYNKDMHKDVPHDHVVSMYNSLKQGPYSIYIVSGREDRFRDVTEKWLKDHGVEGYVALYMRKAGDNRSDVIVKQEILDKYFDKSKVLCVFDDRPRVIAMWKENGLAVFNCGDGVDF